MNKTEQWLLRDTSANYDIYERVFQFAVRVIKFVRTFPRTLNAIEAGRQLVRAVTSTGANLEEADGAITRREFVYKAGVSRKEAREVRFWLRICMESAIGDFAEAKSLYKESDEIVRILAALSPMPRQTLRNPESGNSLTRHHLDIGHWSLPVSMSEN